MPRRLATLALAAALLAAPAVADDSLARVTARGELRIAVELTPPWAMRDGAGELTGFEVDLARRLAADLGVTPRFLEMPFAGLLPALGAGEADIAAAGISITAERAREVLFSDPTNYTTVEMVVAIAGEDGAPDPTKPGFRIAVLEGSTDAEAAEAAFPGAEIRTFPDMNAALSAAVAGEADAFVASSPVAGLAAHLYDAHLALSPDGPLAMQADAFALRDGDIRLLLFVNSWLAAREADGFLDSLRAHYFGGFDWVDGLPAPE